MAEIFTGMSWESLKMPINAEQFALPRMGINSKGRGGYIQKSGMLIAQEKHPFWKGLVGNNRGRIRMCHHDEKETYCGGCFQREGFIIPTQHVDVEYQRVRKGNWKKITDWRNPRLF